MELEWVGWMGWDHTPSTNTTNRALAVLKNESDRRKVFALIFRLCFNWKRPLHFEPSKNSFICQMYHISIINSQKDDSVLRDNSLSLHSRQNIQELFWSLLVIELFWCLPKVCYESKLKLKYWNNTGPVKRLQFFWKGGDVSKQVVYYSICMYKYAVVPYIYIIFFLLLIRVNVCFELFDVVWCLLGCLMWVLDIRQGT